MILGVPRQHSLFLAACQLVHVFYYREMKTAREIEILFRRLRLYDQLGRRADGLIRMIQRELKGSAMGLDHVRSEIEHMRVQVGRQRKQILHLQRAGISTASAELLLGRMLAKIDGLCDERDRLKKEQDGPMKGRVLGGRSW